MVAALACADKPTDRQRPSQTDRQTFVLCLGWVAFGLIWDCLWVGLDLVGLPLFLFRLFRLVAASFCKAEH